MIWRKGRVIGCVVLYNLIRCFLSRDIWTEPKRNWVSLGINLLSNPLDDPCLLVFTCVLGDPTSLLTYTDSELVCVTTECGRGDHVGHLSQKQQWGFHFSLLYCSLWRIQLLGWVPSRSSGEGPVSEDTEASLRVDLPGMWSTLQRTPVPLKL